MGEHTHNPDDFHGFKDVEQTIGKFESPLKRFLKTHKLKISKNLPLILIFVLVLGSASLLYLNNKYKNTNKDCGKVLNCQNILADSAAAITDSNVVKLKKLTADIQQIKNYDKNANYLFILTKYYILLSDTTNAKKFYDKLVTVYNDASGYDGSLAAVSSTPAQLKADIDIIENTSKTNFHVQYIQPEKN